MVHPLRIVLVGTTHPGNIGASARAMKNMGLEELCLVAPKYFPDPEASARASGADDILDNAQCFTELTEAIADCALVVGASARLRSLPWPMVTPRECGRRLVETVALGPCALVFGQERSGLSNDDLQHCQLLVNIPTDSDYRSLNLAMAVQILAYEIHLARGGVSAAVEREAPPASSEDLERFFAHLESVLVESEFLDPDNPRYLMRRLRRLFYRADLDQNELNILRGILASLQSRTST